MSLLHDILTGIDDDKEFQTDIQRYRNEYKYLGDGGNRENKAQYKNVIILVHGIRTRGKWMDEVTPILSNNKTNLVVKPKYGKFNLVKFLAPKYYLKKEPIRHITAQLIAAEKEYPNTPISIIAHSFGTYILSEILKYGSPIKLHKLILCGCIIKEDYDWTTIINDTRNGLDRPGQIYNELGKYDLWPKVAALHPNYGASGVHGFHDGIYVKQREHNSAHDGVLSSIAAEHYWLPFFK